jgi:poly-beta-1,6-N-acetyl-D-glucosamine synthase
MTTRMEHPKFVVVTPVRNEEAHIGRTIESMVAQTLRPARWVLVNDGSTDRTGDILQQAASQHSWIEVVHRADRGFRKSGAGIVEAFYDGFAQIQGLPWDFLVKLDGDLSFESDYFEKCLGKFERDPKLGVGGGVICRPGPGTHVAETPGIPAFHVRGATKIYRRACWEAMGGLPKAPGWDTIDELRANMLGWTTRTFTDVALIQHRPTGRAESAWKDWVKNGRANYMTGYHPLFMLFKCVKRTLSRPVLVASLGLAWGFLTGYLQRVPPAADPELISYVRREQVKRLLLQPSLWG